MASTTADRTPAGTQLSWIAVVSPILSVAAWVLLATAVPISPKTATRVETTNGGFTPTYELGFAATLTSVLMWLFLILAIIAGIATFSLKSGRNPPNLTRASLGVLVGAGIVIAIATAQP